MRRLCSIAAALLTACTLQAAFADALQPPAVLSADLIRSTVDATGATVRREYFDPDVGARADDALHQRWSAGAYAGVAAPQELARRLTSDLYAVTHDKHLAVTVVAPAARQPGSAPTRAEAARRDNGGVRRVELLAGNVGYVDIRFFWRLDEAQAAVDAAMQLLARADAVIFDMRNNSGGSPETVARVLSYLFDGAPTVLFEITPRTGAPTRYATTPVDGRNGRRPLYVLTSTRSFSGGEGFAFILQDRGRAEVIGEPTAGAANPGRPYPVNDLFAVVVPNGRLLTVPSGRNWEGSGVRPDVSSPADETVRVAHERALRRLIAEAKGPADRQQYEQALQSLSSPR